MGSMLEQLRALVAEGLLAAIDYQFAAFIARFEPEPEVILAAAMVSQALGERNTCVELGSRCEAGEAIVGSGIAAPPLQRWREKLQASDNVASIGGDRALPLTFDGDRLYLSRCFHGERLLAAALIQRAGTLEVNETWLGGRLVHYFGDVGAAPNWQKLAAAVALSRGFALVTGGPGTGKTTTVVKILALLLEQNPDTTIAMAAPTGKAAARLSQSIRSALQSDVAIEPQLAQRIPTRVATIHRLLRPIPNSVRFRHDANRPLACDVLLVDEASMVDTELMTALLSALKSGARIILLGDRDQLPSVGVGQLVHDLCAGLGPRNTHHALPYSVEHAQALGRLCGFDLEPWRAGSPASAIGDCIALLQHSYRFAPDSGIGRLAELVNAGDTGATRQFMEGLQAVPAADVCHIDISANDHDWLDSLAQPWLVLHRIFEDEAVEVGDKLAAQAHYQVLCAVKEGRGSVQQVNGHIEQSLPSTSARRRHGHFPGQPIMVTENDYALQLFNGDSGLVLRGADGQLLAWFEGVDGEPRHFSLSRLPAHETAYAVSVHKSQGSEYRHVALVLPPVEADALTPLVSRELIYTGITRAREQLSLFCTPEALLEGITRRVRRDTGLAERLNSA